MQKIVFNTVLWLFLFFWSTVSGCATTSSGSTAQDPFESFNRHIFAFNEGLDKVVLKPVAKGYKAIMPEPVNQGVTNFFSNLDDIIVIANDLLQFKFLQASSDTGRFLLNSTVGLLGFFDVASKVGFQKHNEDFGQTLGYWGLGNGPYLVLPLFGPSSARDAFGLATDTFLDPLYYYATGAESGAQAVAPYAAKTVDERSDLLGAEKVLDTAALDKYTYIRDAYLARREYLVYDGNPPDEDEDDLFEDDDENDDLDENDDENDDLDENDDEDASE